MPPYLVEDMQTEEQVDSFEADNLIHATNLALMAMCEHLHIDYSTEEGSRSNMYISIKLPYGAKYVFEVGEEGK